MKYPLELYSERQYILMGGQSKKEAAQALAISEQNISEFKPILRSKTIKSVGPGTVSKSNLYWAFVNSSISKAKIQSSEILYAAPSFLANGQQIGLSQYFYVKLRKQEDLEILESLARSNLVEIIGNDQFMPLWYILACNKNSAGNALEMANLFYELGYFDSAEPDLMVDFLMGCTNDPLFGTQWHLNNTGQSGGIAGNDIRACQAWNITTGCANVTVAVLDHGLEFNHPDFNNISPISFDAETGSGPSVVRGSHGMAVAGVIGAAHNDLGVSGVSPNAQLMSISSNFFLAPLLSQRLSNGINFAWQNGAAIINNSWGSNSIENQGLINDAINNAVTQGRGGLGTVVVCISHNDNANSIVFPSNNPQTIAVGAINRTAGRASFSNYGPGLDVVAPGVQISTTDRRGTAGYNTAASPGGDFTTQDGTSFAAPQVSGIAALILSINPNLTAQQVRNIIESSTDKIGGVTYTLNAGEQAGLTWNNQMGYGRVNALKAMQATLPITGPDALCTASTYQINGLPPGASVTWLSSNPSGLYIDPITGAATRAINFAGRVTVTAVIGGGCTPINIPKEVGVGNYTPMGTSSYSNNCSGNSFNVLNTSLSAACTANTPTYFTYNISDLNYTNLAFSAVSVPSGASWSVNGRILSMTVYTPSSQGSRSATVKLNATGPCGPYTVNFTSTAVNYYSSPFSISPNPVVDIVTVSRENDTSMDSTSENLIYGVTIKDLYGTPGEFFEYKTGMSSVNIPVRGFKAGLYILSVFDGKTWRSERLVIQK